MVVLTVGVEAGGRAEGSIRCRRAGVTEGGRCRNQQDSRRDGKAERAAHRHEQHREHGNRTERGADTHGDEQADERDNDRREQLTAADSGNACVYEGVDAAGRLDDRGVAACDEHDDGDLPHQTDAALDLCVDFVPRDSAEHDDNDQTAQRGQREILADDLHDGDNDGRAEHDVMAVFELFRNLRGHRGIRFNIAVLARLAVEHEHREQQAEQHGDADGPVSGGDIVHGHGHAVFREVIRDNALKDQAKAERDGDIRHLMTERQCARDRAAIELHPVHHAEQRRHKNRDIGDMDGNEVLRQAGDERQHTDERQLMAAEQTRELFRENFRESGRGNAGRERAEQDIRERSRGVARKAARQQLHDGLRALRRGKQRNAARHAADDAGDEHGQQHVQSGQAQRAQHQHGHRHRIGEQTENNGHIRLKYLLFEAVLRKSKPYAEDACIR